VGQGDSADAVGQSAEVVGPVCGGQQYVGVAVQFVDHHFDDAVQQRVAARDIPVEGHSLDAEVGAELANGQAAQAVPINHGDRAAENRSTIQLSRPGARAGLGRGQHRRGGAAAARTVRIDSHEASTRSQDRRRWRAWWLEDRTFGIGVSAAILQRNA